MNILFELPMNKMRQNLRVLIAFFLYFSLGSTIFAVGQEFPEIRLHFDEISTLNLFRGLFLSKEQVQKIFALAKKSHELRDNLKAKVGSDQASILKAFKELREALLETPGYEQEAQRKAAEIEGRVRDEIGETQDQIAQLEDEARKILSEAQLSILSEYKPCLIPPHDLKNPTRVGQAGAENGILGKITSLIKATPDDLWKERGDQFLEKVANKMEEKVGAMTKPMRADFIERLKNHAKAIRNSSDVDFQLKKDNFSKELLLINPSKARKHGHREPGLVDRFLFSEAALNIYPMWLANIEKIKTTPTTNQDDLQISERNLIEIGAKVLPQLQRLYKKRQGGPGIQPWETFSASIRAAIENNDMDSFLLRIANSLGALAKAKAGEDIVQAYVRFIRAAVEIKNIPIASPKIDEDPFNLGKEVRESVENKNFADACKNLKKVAETVLRFKKM